MWRQGLAPVSEKWARVRSEPIRTGHALACRLALAACLLAGAERADAAGFAVQTLVPTFGGSTSLGANVSTILALRLWTTLRPRPNPNPNNLDFGTGQIKWSTRVIEGPRQAALKEALDTRSQLALWGAVAEYGPGVIVTSNLTVSPSHVAGGRRQIWAVAVRSVRVELGLPNSSYQFSPLVLGSGVVAKYSRPNQIRVCSDKRADCSDATPLGDPFRVIRLEGDFVLVRQPDRSIGWVALPDLSEAQGEVVDFTAALISYLRGDFEQAESYFTRVAGLQGGKPRAPRRGTARGDIEVQTGKRNRRPAGGAVAQSLFPVRRSSPGDGGHHGRGRAAARRDAGGRSGGGAAAGCVVPGSDPARQSVADERRAILRASQLTGRADGETVRRPCRTLVPRSRRSMR